MREGISVFSGNEVPKGSGHYHIRPDGKQLLIASNKELQMVRRKINPCDIRWTSVARSKNRKGEKNENEPKVVVKPIKILRGYSSVPRSIIQNSNPKASTEKRD
ncbi:60S ribosomal protein L24 [Astathelohania contejeani]|uniref:60S ribosomal protein L24 n=1 Tax=Astathelohania contejeani TaxID=164912 RepID=A0ABQ7I086_9MICR|nr:60S ribosomal protein L24 [Thelohania contejeani]